jgi:hypothetical protein
MTKKTRTILFLICLFLFLLIAPSIIFYSQGYRIDIDPPAGGIKITQTGGLFLKIIPKQVEVFIDGKLKKKTDFFFGSALIENLLPKKYKIQIKKEGYYQWEKNLGIREKEVTEAKNIVLIPENPNFSILTKEVKDFWFSPDEKRIILFEENPSAGGEKSWALKLFDLERNVKSHLIEEKDIYSKLHTPLPPSRLGGPLEVDLLELEFSPDSKEISLEVGLKEQIKYFTLEIEEIPPVLTESEEPSPPFENALTYKADEQDIYYLNNLGHLFKNVERLTEKPFPIKQEIEYALEIFQKFIFLQESQTLYQFNPDLKSFEKFFEPIKDLKISPDYKKLVYFSDYEIWILFLKEIGGLPQRKAGEQLFLIRFSEEIKDCFWLNSNYLIFNAANKIKIAEIDDRDKINIADLGEFKNPRIYWNRNYKKLYLLAEGNLYRSESLLP